MVTVYEVGAGSAIAQVEGYCRHLTDAGTFSANTTPRRTWVTDQLNLDAAYMAAKLQSCGYNYVQSDADVVQLLQHWNTIRTVIAVELANPVEGISGKGNARFQEFKAQLDTLEDVICSAGFEDLGGVVSGGIGEFLVATGISYLRKQEVESDSDHIKHRIRRGQFQPGRTDPTAETDWGNLTS